MPKAHGELADLGSQATAGAPPLSETHPQGQQAKKEGEHEDANPGRQKALSKTTPRRSIPANTSPAEAEPAMVGSDVPPGGSGVAPGSPEKPRKRKSFAAAAEEDAAAASSSARRATRSSASALVDGAVLWARHAATGALWAVRGRNRGIVDEEKRMAVILALRYARSEEVDPNEPGSPYSKKQKRLHKRGTRSSGRIAGDLSNLSSFLVSTRKRIGVDAVKYQAAIPELVAPSEEAKAEYRNETLQKMGTLIRLPPIVEPRKTRKAVDNKCKCSHPGSEACVGVHVKEAWKRVKYQLGEQGFRNVGFDAMGERVLKLWSAEEKKKLADVEKSVPQNKHEDFIQIAGKQFKSERRKDLVSYYYNIFLPRRLASLNRTEATIDDEGNNEDDNNVHHSEEKGKGSSKRSRK